MNKDPELLTIISQEEFWSDEQDLSVQSENAAVEAVVAVRDGHADVEEDPIA
jgi:hypothetical protein